MEHTERTKQMQERAKYLHFTLHWSKAKIADQIAEEFGGTCSREYVRQLIGNSGHWNEEKQQYVPHFKTARH